MKTQLIGLIHALDALDGLFNIRLPFVIRVRKGNVFSSDCVFVLLPLALEIKTFGASLYSSTTLFIFDK